MGAVAGPTCDDTGLAHGPHHDLCDGFAGVPVTDWLWPLRYRRRPRNLKRQRRIPLRWCVLYRFRCCWFHFRLYWWIHCSCWRCLNSCWRCLRWMRSLYRICRSWLYRWYCSGSSCFQYWACWWTLTLMLLHRCPRSLWYPRWRHHRHRSDPPCRCHRGEWWKDRHVAPVNWTASSNRAPRCRYLVPG